MTFNLLLKGTYQLDPFKLSLDFSNYIAPERDEGESVGSYTLRLVRQYSAFIKTMHYGNRYDFFYFRYGKLDNISLGDGALLSSYFDNSVGYLESKPGLNVKIGPLGHIGFEMVTDNIFEPTMIASRSYLMPFAMNNPAMEKRINRMEWAYSFVFDPRSSGEVEEDDYSYRSLFLGSIEIAQPLFSGKEVRRPCSLIFCPKGKRTICSAAEKLCEPEFGVVRKACSCSISVRRHRFAVYITTIISPPATTTRTAMNTANPSANCIR